MLIKEFDDVGEHVHIRVRDARRHLVMKSKAASNGVYVDDRFKGAKLEWYCQVLESLGNCERCRYFYRKAQGLV
jgi:hypothetical protein